MASFSLAHGIVKKWEGGHVHDAMDRGGETFGGISRKSHPTWMGWPLIDSGSYSLTQLEELSETLYRREYWGPIQGELIPMQRLANIVYQAAVNCGKVRASRWLQLSINLFHDPDLKLDGTVGNHTLYALTETLSHGHGEDLCEDFLLRQKAHYHAIVEADHTQKRFIRGWLNRIKDL